MPHIPCPRTSCALCDQSRAHWNPPFQNPRSATVDARVVYGWGVAWCPAWWRVLSGAAHSVGVGIVARIAIVYCRIVIVYRRIAMSIVASSSSIVASSSSHRHRCVARPPGPPCQTPPKRSGYETTRSPAHAY